VILFVNPRATRPKNRRFPLSLMAVGAALPRSVSWKIVDENLPNIDVLAAIRRQVEERAGTADPWISRHSRLLAWLAAADRRLARPLARFGDHIAYLFERVER